MINRSPKIKVTDKIKKVALSNKNLSVQNNLLVKEINGNGKKVISITVEDRNSKKREEILLDGVFVAAGVLPNTEIFKDQIELDRNKYIKNIGRVGTSKRGVFWCGDVGHSKYQQAIVASGEGCMAALDAMESLDEV